MSIKDAFDKFLENISLTQTQEDRIESSVSGLKKAVGEAYEIPEGERDEKIFTQGSFANDTAVRPADSDGEYDVDLIVLCAGADDSSEDALDDLTEKLENHGTYGDMLDEPKDPCVRVKYADETIGGYHVDLVPSRNTVEGADTAAPIEVPRRGEDWHGSDPAEFTDWARDRPEPFHDVVKMLKRWRDVNSSAAEGIKSIVLQVLVSDHLGTEVGKDFAVEGVLDRMNNFLADHPTPPTIKNPVLEEEDFAARWTQESYEKFKSELSKAYSIAHEALTSPHTPTRFEKWQELFGGDFPDYESGGQASAPIGPPPNTAIKNERYGAQL